LRLGDLLAAQPVCERAKERIAVRRLYGRLLPEVWASCRSSLALASVTTWAAAAVV
jgi:hypothetical protein